MAIGAANRELHAPRPENRPHGLRRRAHLICVFTALSTEAKSLTQSYTKIVEAKYPELNGVDDICKLNPESLASDIAGSEDFTKRFAVLKS
jgi:hypothetical protein